MNNGSNENQSPIAGKISGSMEELERMQGSETSTSDEVRECLKDSLDCYQTCTETMIRCLTIGGKHAETRTSESLNGLRQNVQYKRGFYA